MDTSPLDECHALILSPAHELPSTGPLEAILRKIHTPGSGGAGEPYVAFNSGQLSDPSFDPWGWATATGWGERRFFPADRQPGW